MLPFTLRTAALAAAALTLALGAAACGGDKKDSGLGTADYIAKADALCKPSPQGPQTQDPKVSARFLREKLIPFRKRTLANLRKLEPNSDIKPKVERYLSILEGTTVLIGQQADALAGGDRIKAGDLDVAISQAQARRNKAAAEVGYKRCGQPIQGPPVTAAGFESAAVLEPADAACKRATDAVLATKPKDFEPPTLAASVEQTLPEQKRALGVLQGLRGQAKKPAYAQFVSIEEQRYAQALKIIAAGKANDQPRFDRLQAQDGELYNRGTPIALHLGFTVCGVSSPIGF
jgi:hypothetical protein